VSKTEAVSKTVEELQAAWKAAQKRSNAAHAAWRDAFRESVVAYLALNDARKLAEQTPGPRAGGCAMNIYMLAQKHVGGKGTYVSCVVVAASESDARRTHPLSCVMWDGVEWVYEGLSVPVADAGGWCPPDAVEVSFVGVAESSLHPGVLCATAV